VAPAWRHVEQCFSFCSQRAGKLPLMTDERIRKIIRVDMDAF
jgi:hypothetical protein